ncbi:MAG: peptide-binding protein, partial [Rhodospirillales bacterium]|nr:peptide-binding protein [Rhodospirillales bacterium]
MTIRGTIQGKRFGRTRFALAVGAAIVALATAQAAQAYEAYVTQAAPILTGPSADYPAVVYLRGGEPVEVYGCLPDYDWCDISFRDYRGWFDANLLAYPYQGRRVPLYDYGYDIGLPIIGFSLGDYWGRYYRDRPFFRERERWAHIPLSPPREDHRRFDGRPGFDRQGGRPDFDRDHGPRQGRPDFDRDHGPQQGRPDFDRDHGPQQGRPDFGRDHGP